MPDRPGSAARTSVWPRSSSCSTAARRPRAPPHARRARAGGLARHLAARSQRRLVSNCTRASVACARALARPSSAARYGRARHERGSPSLTSAPSGTHLLEHAAHARAHLDRIDGFGRADVLDVDRDLRLLHGCDRHLERRGRDRRVVAVARGEEGEREQRSRAERHRDREPPPARKLATRRASGRCARAQALAARRRLAVVAGARVSRAPASASSASISSARASASR